MKHLVIFGIGKIADVALGHILRDAAYEVVGFTCDAAYVPAGGQHYGRPVVAFADVEGTFPPDSVEMFVAVGYHGLNAVRTGVCALARQKGYKLASYVSPRADTGPWLTHGDNCLILDGVGIQPGVVLGNNVSIWNNSLIGHHSTIEDDCWIAAGATLGGMVQLGNASFVGLNATIAGEVTLGERALVGASALVTKSAPAKSVFVAPGTEKFRLDSTLFIRMTTMSAIGTQRTDE